MKIKEYFLDHLFTEKAKLNFSVLKKIDEIFTDSTQNLLDIDMQIAHSQAW